VRRGLSLVREAWECPPLPPPGLSLFPSSFPSLSMTADIRPAQLFALPRGETGIKTGQNIVTLTSPWPLLWNLLLGARGVLPFSRVVCVKKNFEERKLPVCGTVTQANWKLIGRPGRFKKMRWIQRHSLKLGKKRRESSRRNYYIISPRVIIKAIITRCSTVWAQNSPPNPSVLIFRRLYYSYPWFVNTCNNLKSPSGALFFGSFCTSTWIKIRLFQAWESNQNSDREYDVDRLKARLCVQFSLRSKSWFRINKM